MYRKVEDLTKKSEVAVEKLLDRILRWWFSSCPRSFNNWIRNLDRNVNRLVPGTGHSRGAVLLGIAALLIIILGPTASLIQQFSLDGPLVERIVGLLVAGGGAWFLWWAARKWPGKKLHTVQCLVLIPVGLIVFFLPDSYTEASGAPFPHIYALIIVILMLLTIVARSYSHYVLKSLLPEEPSSEEQSKPSSISEEEKVRIKGFAKTLADLIHASQLNLMIEVQNPPSYSRPNAVQTMFSAPARKPLLLVFLPCLAAILVPDVELARVVAGIFLLVSWALITWGSYYARWDLLISLLTRWFMQGSPLVISLLVVVLGIGQLLDIQYVTTLLLGGPVFSLLFSAYLVIWLFEYWINRFFYENLLTVFKTDYPHNDDEAWEISLRPQNTQRADKMTVLGGSRFLVQDAKRSQSDDFRIYMPYRLLDRLVLGIPGDQGRVARTTVNEMKNRLRAYFTLINGALAIILLTAASYEFSWKAPRPIVTLETADSPSRQAEEVGPNLLVERLKKIAASDNSKAVLVAASGGGSRAALYTASVLCGLHRMGAGQNIALVSAVSGGSAAAAYYAANIDQLKGLCETELLVTGKKTDPWPSFYRTMGESFIDDVLRGVVERRIVGPDQNGVLLSESFQRYFKTDRTIGQVKETGLIFNTTLTGHPYQESADLTAAFGSDAGNTCINNEFIVHAGSRLIVTNLPREGFPTQGPSYARDAFLHYSVIDKRQAATIKARRFDSLPLFTAAALSANFPPVFSDAGLQIDRPINSGTCPDRYWVTDGGAAENRGILSLLYALRAALETIDSAESLPDLHIVVAEASAESIDYAQIRGIGGKLAASKHIASELKVELLRDINRRVCDLRGEVCEDGKSAHVQVHYLEMPTIFSTRGGIGTHWKLPWRVTFSNPRNSDKDADDTDSVWISKALELMANLHGPGGCTERIDERFREWVCDVDPHQRIWEGFSKTFKAQVPTKGSSG